MADENLSYERFFWEMGDITVDSDEESEDEKALDEFWQLAGRVDAADRPTTEGRN